MFAKKKPLTLYRHPGLYLEEVDGKGRGVFCLEDLKEGDEIEVTPVIITPGSQFAALSQTLIFDYIFRASAFPDKFLRGIGIENPEEATCLPLGVTSLCNHMIEPNAAYRFDVDDMSPFVTLLATRDIPKGEEITVSYGAAWFGVRKLKPVRR